MWPAQSLVFALVPAVLLLAQLSTAAPLPLTAVSATHDYVKRTDNPRTPLHLTDEAAETARWLAEAYENLQRAGTSSTPPAHAIEHPAMQFRPGPRPPYVPSVISPLTPPFGVGLTPRPFHQWTPIGHSPAFSHRDATLGAMSMPARPIYGPRYPVALRYDEGAPVDQSGLDQTATEHEHGEGPSVPQVGDEALPPSARRLSPAEIQALDDDRLEQMGPELLDLTMRRASPATSSSKSFRIATADATLQSWLLEVLRRRVTQVRPYHRSKFSQVAFSLVPDDRPVAIRANRIKNYLGHFPYQRPRVFRYDRSPFAGSFLETPLEAFDVGAYRVFINNVRNFPKDGLAMDESSKHNVFAFRRDSTLDGVVTFSRLELHPATGSAVAPRAPIDR